jgi:hypothetical protein
MLGGLARFNASWRILFIYLFLEHATERQDIANACSFLATVSSLLSFAFLVSLSFCLRKPFIASCLLFADAFGASNFAYRGFRNPPPRHVNYDEAFRQGRESNCAHSETAKDAYFT